MANQKLLIIGLVWPEPQSSAAGTRMVQLINLFLDAGYDITFASAAAKSEFSYPFYPAQVKSVAIKLNHPSFNAFLKDLNPDVVLYDRFMIEEQYGWRVQQECPNSLRILDTEDLHCLRNARQEQEKTQSELNLFSDTAKREIASILRCDVSLIISEFEMDILKNVFKIDASLLYYLPFLTQKIDEQATQKWPSFEQRKDFIFIGNFLHEPNYHTVKVLKQKIWPLLRKKLPQANLHIYGAYPSQKVQQLNNKAERFIIKGRAADAQDCMCHYRILLAPILFGAGLKGKFIDAMCSGTPAATTTVGAEAMQGNVAWNGFIEDDLALFAEKAATLYENEKDWYKAQKNGINLINERFSAHQFTGPFIQYLQKLDLKKHRQGNFIGQILHHHSLQSTKYLSLWIEEKNKN